MLRKRCDCIEGRDLAELCIFLVEVCAFLLIHQILYISRIKRKKGCLMRFVWFSFSAGMPRQVWPHFEITELTPMGKKVTFNVPETLVDRSFKPVKSSVTSTTHTHTDTHNPCGVLRTAGLSVKHSDCHYKWLLGVIQRELSKVICSGWNATNTGARELERGIVIMPCV